MSPAIYGPLISLAGAAIIAIAREVYLRRTARGSELEVVRVDVKTDEDFSPVLDITVRNTGTAPAMIHEFIVDGIEVWAFPHPGKPSARPVSRRYEVDLRGDADQFHRLSQEVRGGDGDRFEIRLGTSDPIFPYVGGFLYLFRAALVVDAARRELELGRFLVRLPQPMRALGIHGVGRDEQELRELVEKAKRLTERVSNGVIVHDRAQAILDEVERVNLPDR
jgi:hypothetical protein